MILKIPINVSDFAGGEMQKWLSGLFKATTFREEP